MSERLFVLSVIASLFGGAGGCAVEDVAIGQWPAGYTCGEPKPAWDDATSACVCGCDCPCGSCPGDDCPKGPEADAIVEGGGDTAPDADAAEVADADAH